MLILSHMKDVFEVAGLVVYAGRLIRPVSVSLLVRFSFIWSRSCFDRSLIFLLLLLSFRPVILIYIAPYTARFFLLFSFFSTSVRHLDCSFHCKGFTPPGGVIKFSSRLTSRDLSLPSPAASGEAVAPARAQRLVGGQRQH